MPESSSKGAKVSLLICLVLKAGTVSGGSLLRGVQHHGKQPSCPNQEPCSFSDEHNLNLYSVHKVVNAATGTCNERCVGGKSLSNSLLVDEFACGRCPSPCPDQEPCGDFGNGFLAYRMHRYLPSGLCERVCAATTSLQEYLENPEWTCGDCPVEDRPNIVALPGSPSNPMRHAILGPTCPNQEPCHLFGGVWDAYRVWKQTNGGMLCDQRCAASSTLQGLLDDGYVCGECPAPTCPNQEPCGYDEAGNYNKYHIFMHQEDGVCRSGCFGGNQMTNALVRGFDCGHCP